MVFELLIGTGASKTFLLAAASPSSESLLNFWNFELGPFPENCPNNCQHLLLCFVPIKARNLEIFSEYSDVGNQMWLPMCGGLAVAYSQCCGVVNAISFCEGNSDGLCEMFFDGASTLLVNLANAQERMAKK